METKTKEEILEDYTGDESILARMQQYADQECAAKEEEINEYSRNLKNCVDNGSKLVNEIYQQQKEIEWLKRLIRLAFDSGYTAGYIDHGSTGKSKIEKSWQQFKNENNF